MKVIYDDGKRHHESPKFPETNPPLAPGDEVEFNVSSRTLGGEFYRAGDRIKVVARTSEKPHNRWTTIGNLLVRGKNARLSVWTNIEWGLHEGWLKRVGG